MIGDGRVQLLDTNTANQIAAGEVVEKPASVVKELVENALDAGATTVEVTIYAGGTEYIRVVDNGSGMNEENARMAVLRHATSKLRSADDLLSLHTLGFRGEALPSIASVSKFTLLTRPAADEFATSIYIEGGENMEVSSAGGSAGTTVIVEQLFFNVPARRKFLKTVSTEGRYISELLTKLALSRPDVRFKLVSNDKEVLSTPGDGDLASAIRSLYGKNVAAELLNVELLDPKITIQGFIGKPTLLKGTRQWQTIFVNGRSISNKMIAKAIDHAYQSQIPKSGFPFAVLNIIVDTASIDVNVHPQKSEIKFSDDSTVYKAMYKALTDALTKPMSAHKAQINLLPDSELNVYVKEKQEMLVQRLAAENTAKTEPVKAKATAATAQDFVHGKPDYRQIFKTSMGEIFRTPETESVEEVTSGADTKAAMVKEAVEPKAELNYGGSYGQANANALASGEPEHNVAAAKEIEKKFVYGNEHEVDTQQIGYATPFTERKEMQNEAVAVKTNEEQLLTAHELPAAEAKPIIEQQAMWKPFEDFDNGRRETVFAVHEARSEFQEDNGVVADRETIAFTNTDNDMATIWPIGQVDKTFIIAQSEDTLYLIDQHAAHERILYDKLVAAHNNIPAQTLLIPLYMDMDADDVSLVLAHKDEFMNLGVEADAAGEDVLRISSLPTDIKVEDAEEFVLEICKMLREMRSSISASELRQELLHMTACKAAIKAGQLLNMRQMRQLIVELCNTTHPFTCPHGRPCMIEIDSDKLYKMFKRTGF